MPIVTLPSGLFLPAPLITEDAAPGLIATTTAAINASGEKWAFIFRCPRAGALDKVEFAIRSVTNQPDNGLRISFQDLDASGDPDGVQDQFRTITGPFSSDSWIVPGLITSDGTDGGTKRTVTAGQKIAVVVEFENFVAGDDISACFLNLPTAPGGILGDNYTAQFASGAWTKALNSGAMALKYTSGGYTPVADDWFPLTTLDAVAYGTGSANDEFALRFQVPTIAQCAGGWVRAEIDGDAEMILYDSDGSTVLGSSTFDASARPVTDYSNHHGRWAPVTLQPSTTYRLALKPTTATTINLARWTAANASILAAAVGGVQWYQSKRADAGSWTDETTHRPFMGILISGLFTP